MKTRITASILISLLILSFDPRASATPSLQFDGSTAYSHVLKQISLGPRVPGTPALLAAAAYIKANLTSLGWNVTFQNFTYYNRLLNETIEASNIIATIAMPLIHCMGTCYRVVLGAHFDSRPFADGPNSNNHTAPVPGADDGASGVAVLLELGRVFALNRPVTRLTMAFFDAEDSGLKTGEGWILGSEQYVQSLNSSDRSRIDAAIILDMVGYSDLALKREALSDYAISSAMWSQGRALGYAQFVDGVQRAILDDHKPFLDAGIRAVDIIDFDYPYWHTPNDTADKVSANSLEAVGRTVESYIRLGVIQPYTLPFNFYLVLGGLLVATGVAVMLLVKARKERSRKMI